MIPGQMSRLENMHYEFEGQAHKWAILLTRGSTKRGCLHWVLKDGKNVDTQMEWGGGGISGRGVGGSKGEETGAGTQCWRRATKSGGSRARQEIRWGVSTGPVRSRKATLANEASRTAVVGWRAVA